MKMKRMIVFLCFMAIAWTAPVSHNERSCTGDNKDVSAASNVSEHDAVKNSQEYFEHQNAKKASGNTSLTSEGHSGARSEDSRIKESHATASLVVGAADFVAGNGNGGGKTKPNLSKIPGSKRNKAANGNGAGGESINGNIEDGVFGSSPNGTGGRNVHDTSQAELSRLDQNDKKCSNREKAASRNKVGDRWDDTVGSHSNQVQSLASTNVGVPERREPADHTSLKFMRNKVYGESIQWTDMNEGASGHGGDTSEEGSTDGWSDENSEDTKDLGANETEMHGARSKSQAHDSTGIASPNNGGDGDRSSLDDSLSTSEEDSSQQDNSMSVEKDETVELCDKAKKNEYINIQKKRSGLPVLKGIGKGKNGHKKKGMAGNRGDLNEKRTDLPDDRKAIGGLLNTNRSQGAYKHRNKPREDSRDISNEDESNNSYSFSDEFMQGDSPNDSHESEGSENSEQDEEESTSKDASDERSKSNDGDSDSQPYSSETEDVSQSASSENKPGSGDTKSDSSSESESKPASSESKSDSSNESESELDSSKSNSSSESKSENSESKSESSEGKSDSSSESKSESSEGKSDSSSESKSESSEGKSDSSSESKSESSEGKSDSSSESKSESTEGKSDGSTESKSESSEGKSDSSSESKSDSSGSKSVSSEGKSDSSSESKSDSSDGSSEGNSDSSSDTKTDSSSESKSESSESKSDSSSESKSNSSSEGKSGSSSESNSSGESENSRSSTRAVSSEKDTQSSTSNDASDESKSNESESQSASYSDSGMVSMSDESGADGSDVTDTAENTSDSESAESKESDGDSPLGSVDSESESISEGSESNDSTSDY